MEPYLDLDEQQLDKEGMSLFLNLNIVKSKKSSMRC